MGKGLRNGGGEVLDKVQMTVARDPSDCRVGV